MTLRLPQERPGGAEMGKGIYVRSVKRQPISRGTYYDVPLACGAVTKIDKEDWALVSKNNWFVTGKYATGTIAGKRVGLHRLLLKPLKRGQCVDHINGDALDNRRANLRVCTAMENSRNRKVNYHKKHKGTHFLRTAYRLAKPWQAYISVNKKKINLGYFTTESAAARAYNAAATEHFGQFAKLNEGSQS